MDYLKKFHQIANDLIENHEFTEFHRPVFYVDAGVSIKHILTLAADEKGIPLVACNSEVGSNMPNRIAALIFTEVGQHYLLLNVKGEVKLYLVPDYSTLQLRNDML